MTPPHAATVLDSIAKPSAAPCGTCPYRRDVPAGVWDASEYEKLPAYDNETWAQPLVLFFCHQNDGHLCGGWVGCHDTDNLLSLRLHRVHPDTFAYESSVPLFASGADAARHGLSGVDSPDGRAVAAINKLERRREAVAVLDSIAKPSPLVAMLSRNAIIARRFNEEAQRENAANELMRARRLKEESRHDADDGGTENGDEG